MDVFAQTPLVTSLPVSLTALQYVAYLRSCGWRHVFT